jgi:membrane peptidoglycan carboxypeptidase
MKKLFKYFCLSLFITLAVGSVCYLYSLHKARQYTLAVIAADLEKSQWRNPDGTIHKFAICSQNLSEKQREILIKVEDPGFYDHNGIDLTTPGAGLTTITQAITKILYFDHFKPGMAKIKQSLIARFVVDEIVSKDDQLTLFINTMSFGRVKGKSIVGLASAANAYYHQSVQGLTEDQYISLIAMLVMPSTFHPVDHPEWNRDRVDRIKALIAGEYQPEGLMDQFYGELPEEVVDAGLPPASYFGKSSKDMNIKD